MKPKFFIHILTIAMVLLAASGVYAQRETGNNEKLAQTGMKFLSVSPDARISALGESNASVEGYSSSMFYNPAGMARLAETTINGEASFGSTSWIADIKYLHGSVALSPMNGDFGTIGLSFVSVDYGEFNKTIRANNEKGFIDIGTYKPSAYAFGIGYAKALSEKFSVGGNIKYCVQDLGKHVIGISPNGGYVEKDYMVDVLAFDFGVIYKTGFKSLNLGMTIRNFSEEIQYEEEGFQLPLTLKIGLSVNAVDFFNIDPKMHAFLVTVDASHPRDFAEQISVGGEYTFMNTFSVRGSYKYPADEHNYTVGAGVNLSYAGYSIGADYAYTPFGIFDNVHRIGVKIGF